MPSPADPSPVLLAGFWSLLLVTSVAALALVRRYTPQVFTRALLVFGVWVAAAGALAATGIAANFDLRPPPFIAYVVSGFVACIFLARSEWGLTFSRKVPLAVLIGFQAFRLPLELLLHRAHVDGLNPVQMTFAGMNFDIVTGVLALVVGAWAARAKLPTAIAWAFNLVGLALLLTIVGIAIASTPVFEAFGPDAVNTWVTRVPFVWLPAVFVMAAWLGHLLLLRRLLSDAKTAQPA